MSKTITLITRKLAATDMRPARVKVTSSTGWELVAPFDTAAELAHSDAASSMARALFDGPFDLTFSQALPFGYLYIAQGE